MVTMGRAMRVGVWASVALAATLLVVWGAGGPAGASASPPLRGTFVADETRTPDPGCGGLHITGNGAGSATRLGGQAGIEFDECVDFAEDPGSVHVDGTAVLTAANGDELHIIYALEGGLPDPVTGEVTAAGPFTVTGGTGRFSQATGGGTLHAVTTLTVPVVTITLDGVLVTAHRQPEAGAS